MTELPNNIEAEQAVLGAILIDNYAFESIDFLKPEHFHQNVHSRIFNACLEAFQEGKNASAVTLFQDFKNDTALSNVGGAAYLARLGASATTISNVAHYGLIIKDLFDRRELIELARVAEQQAMTAAIQQPARELIEQLQTSLLSLSEFDNKKPQVIFKDSVREALKAVDAAYKNDGRIAGLSTGFVNIDESTGGLYASDLSIIAGRPGMGKTALVTNISVNVAKQGKAVLFQSLEMSHAQLSHRIIASQAGVNSQSMRHGTLTDYEFERVIRASKEIEGLPIIIDDTPAIHIGTARTRARQLHRSHNFGLIVFDYIGIAKGDSKNRVQELDEISGGLKALAKDLNVPVIALSQLNRGVEQRDDKRPQLSDLRESGAIEQNADVVMFIYRDEYYCKREEPDFHKNPEKHADWEITMQESKGRAELIISKNRHGATNTIQMSFDATRTQFGDI